jgi:hypothetical protein
MPIVLAHLLKRIPIGVEQGLHRLHVDCCALGPRVACNRRETEEVATPALDEPPTAAEAVGVPHHAV